MVKGFNLPIDYVLYEMSYANMTMYSSVLSTCGKDNNTADGDNEVVNADDPKNKEIVRNIMFS